MSDHKFQRWEDIVDREALGEPISAADTAFRREFERQNPLCARESTAWEAMLGTLAHTHAQDVEAGRAKLIEGVLAQARSAEATPVANTPVAKPIPQVASVTKMPRTRTWVAAGLAIAASVALIVWSKADTGTSTGQVASTQPVAPKTIPTDLKRTPKQVPQQEKTLPVQTEGPVVALISGTENGSTTLTIGDAIALNREITAAGDTCFVYQQPFAGVCLQAGSRFTLSQSQSTRTVALHTGRAVANLDKLPRGEHFEITTATTTATAIGTIFEVQHDSESSRVAVLEGEVGVREAAGEVVSVRAGSMLGQGADTPTQATDLEWSTSRSGLAELWRGHDASQMARLELPAANPGAVAMLNGHALGDSSVTMWAPAGSHELLVRRGRRDAKQAFALEPNSVHRVGALPIPRPTTPTPTKARPVGEQLASLKSQARAARTSRNWGTAAAHYREIVKLAPSSAIAQTSRIQLGDLLRTRLNDPKAALATYRDYLKSGGSLMREARYGEIRALRDLGQLAAEKRAITAFLERYPNSLAARELRERLASI